MTDADRTLQRLKKRSEFLACAQAPSCAKGAVVVQGRPRGDEDGAIRVGFTATKRIGGIPEPATWGLMIAGFGIVGGSLRRKRAFAASCG